MTENKKDAGVRIAKRGADRGQTDQAGTMVGSPQSDAKGAGARSQADGSNDGVASAEPKVLSGKKSGDATFRHTYDGIDKE